MDQDCETCQLLERPSRQLLSTANWRVSLGNNQAYLGRAYITLRHHKASLSKLDVDEWRELQELIQKLEPAYAQAFGAAPINWCSFMDHAFRDANPQPHVHWHIIPRYKHTPTIKDIAFDDPTYGDLFDHKAERIVGDEMVDEIIKRLAAYL